MLAFLSGLACALLVALSLSCLHAGASRYAAERTWTLAAQHGELATLTETAHSAL